MIRSASALIALGVLFSLSPEVLLAQQGPTEPLRYGTFFGLGAGAFPSVGSGAKDPGLAATGGIAVEKHRHRFALRGSVASELLGGSVSDVGLLYGRKWSGERIDGSLSAGAALVRNQDCAFLGGCDDPTTTVGLPLSARFSFRPVRAMGIGLEAFGNLNSSSSFVAGAVVLELGSLR